MSEPIDFDNDPMATYRPALAKLADGNPAHRAAAWPRKPAVERASSGDPYGIPPNGYANALAARKDVR